MENNTRTNANNASTHNKSEFSESSCRYECGGRLYRYGQPELPPMPFYPDSRYVRHQDLNIYLDDLWWIQEKIVSMFRAWNTNRSPRQVKLEYRNPVILELGETKMDYLTLLIHLGLGADMHLHADALMLRLPREQQVRQVKQRGYQIHWADQPCGLPQSQFVPSIEFEPNCRKIWRSIWQNA